jgi:hypothetical protein
MDMIEIIKETTQYITFKVARKDSAPVFKMANIQKMDEEIVSKKDLTRYKKIAKAMSQGAFITGSELESKLFGKAA